MSKYYCRECYQILDEDELIRGRTYSIDSYTNDACPCGSEDITELNSDDICPVCGDYHDKDYAGDFERCFKNIYTDARGTLYMMKYWGVEKTFETMVELSDEGSGETTQSILWESFGDNVGNVKEFLRFICGFDDARTDIWRNHNFMTSLQSGGGIYGFIDTGEPIAESKQEKTAANVVALATAQKGA